MEDGWRVYSKIIKFNKICVSLRNLFLFDRMSDSVIIKARNLFQIWFILNSEINFWENFKNKIFKFSFYLSADDLNIVMRQCLVIR